MPSICCWLQRILPSIYAVYSVFCVKDQNLIKFLQKFYAEINSKSVLVFSNFQPAPHTNTAVQNSVLFKHILQQSYYLTTPVKNYQFIFQALHFTTNLISFKGTQE